MKKLFVVVFALAACGGKASSPATTPTSGGATSDGAATGGTTYGGATYGAPTAPTPPAAP